MPIAAFAGIRAISLDWGDTLAASAGMPYEPVQRRAFFRFGEELRRLGGRLGPDHIDRWLAAQLAAYRFSVDPVRNPTGEEMVFARLLSDWARDAGVDPQTARAAIDTCEDALTEVLALFAAAPRVLAELKRRGYRIGILSQIVWSGPACRRYFIRHGLGHLIDAYSFSSEVGRAKPHPDHYADLVNRLGLTPDRILHVGDNPGRDIDGARAFGFRTGLIETAGLHRPEALAACQADVRIVRLDELPDLLPERAPEALGHPAAVAAGPS